MNQDGCKQYFQFEHEVADSLCCYDLYWIANSMVPRTGVPAAPRSSTGTPIVGIRLRTAAGEGAPKIMLELQRDLTFPGSSHWHCGLGVDKAALVDKLNDYRLLASPSVITAQRCHNKATNQLLQFGKDEEI
eukprot:514881-Amphidinium_carterae.1